MGQINVFGDYQSLVPGNRYQCGVGDYQSLVPGNRYQSAQTANGICGVLNYYITPDLKQEEKMGMMDSLKGYYKRHEDVLFTIGFILILDYFLFGGALRIKVKAIVEKMILNVEDKLKIGGSIGDTTSTTK